jgi:hypothetical protein
VVNGHLGNRHRGGLVMVPKLLWAIWFGSVLGSFVVIETYMLVTIGPAGTLSVWMRDFAAGWPWIKWVWLGGALVLFVHFWYQRYL